MTTRNQLVDEDDRLWFFMSRSSGPVSDLLIDRNVNVCFTDPASHSYVSVSGEASAVSDPAKLRQLWTKTASEWFAGGDRKSTRLNSSHLRLSRMPSSA